MRGHGMRDHRALFEFFNRARYGQRDALVAMEAPIDLGARRYHAAEGIEQHRVGCRRLLPERIHTLLCGESGQVVDSLAERDHRH